MTSLAWPEELPIPRLSGLSASRKSSVVRTEMDAGPAKARRRYTVATKEFSGSIVVKENERAILENFYVATLGDGVLRFVMRDPQTLVESEFRFMEDYGETSNGDGTWTINLKLEKMNA